MKLTTLFILGVMMGMAAASPAPPMNFTGLFTSANTTTGGMYGLTLPFLIMIIAYAAMGAFGFNRAFSGATFLAFVASLPLFALGVVPDYIMVILVMFVMVGVFFLMRSESG